MPGPSRIRGSLGGGGGEPPSRQLSSFLPPAPGDGSDRVSGLSLAPHEVGDGPSQPVPRALNGCRGVRPTNPKPRRSRPGTLPEYHLPPASMSASVGSIRISSPAATLAASPTTGSAAGRWAPGCSGTASSGRSLSPPGATTAAGIRPWPPAAAKPCWRGPTAPGASPKPSGSWPRPIASLPPCWRTAAASTRGSGGWVAAAAPRGPLLDMAAVAAIRWNAPLRAFYQRLRARGKEANMALVAVTRKLVVLANALLRADRLWQDAPPPRPSTELATQGSR